MRLSALAVACVAALTACQTLLTPPSSEALGNDTYRVGWGPGPAVYNSPNSWSFVASLAEKRCPNGYSELQRTVDRTDGLVLRMTVRCQ